ncbi:unknown [Firmicutes bacterium CAG:475]|nr:unknown [Firmicutes bacterium CAG:475]
MTCVLQTLCNDHLHKMSDMKTVRSRVETDIKRLRTLVQQLFEILLKNDLLYKSALAKLIDNVL